MQIIQSKLLKRFTNLTHGFTTKDGGRSSSPYTSLNLAFHVGDKEESVKHNHKLLAQKLAYNSDSLIHMKQIHSNIVYTPTASENFLNPPSCDALITNRVKTPLMVMVADCSPILFYDDMQRVIAVAHAGRAGTFQNIVANVLKRFKSDFDSKIDNILISIGPAIQRCCYEVGEEIYNEAKALNYEYAIDKKEEKYFLNIALILKNQLLEAGINEKNIEISKECSCCQKEKFFSYRASGKTGRFAGVIELK